MLNTLTILCLKENYITTWVFKIDNEFSGRGIAYFSVGQIKGFRDLINNKNGYEEEELV